MTSCSIQAEIAKRADIPFILLLLDMMARLRIQIPLSKTKIYKMYDIFVSALSSNEEILWLYIAVDKPLALDIFESV